MNNAIEARIVKVEAKAKAGCAHAKIELAELKKLFGKKDKKVHSDNLITR